MKRVLLFVSLVLGVALLGSAQTAPDVAKIRATTIVKDGNGFHMRGAVEVVTGGVRITADEADMTDPHQTPEKPHQVDVRGNVHIIVAGPMTIEKRQRTQ
jgi:lipopolysaccharide export system protein LptA